MSVLVTGANSFVGSHCVDMLISKGYTVVGTVRSQAKAEPFVEGFAKKYPASKKVTFEVVPDIAEMNAFDKILNSHKDINYVLHVASPIFSVDSVEVGVAGIQSLLNSIKACAPQITNVIVTSSGVAMTRFPIPEEKSVFTDKDWNDITMEEIEKNPEDVHTKYCACKKFSEQAAWDFVEQEKPNFKLGTIMPSMIYGPQVFDSLVGEELSTTNQSMSRLAKGGDILPFFMPLMLAADVRYIAQVHVAAFEQEVLFGKRIVTAVSSTPDQLIVDVLNKNFPELKLAKGTPGKYPPANITMTPSACLSEVKGLNYSNIEETIYDVTKQYLTINKLI